MTGEPFPQPLPRDDYSLGLRVGEQGLGNDRSSHYGVGALGVHARYVGALGAGRRSQHLHEDAESVGVDIVAVHLGYGMGGASAVQLGQEPHRTPRSDQRPSLVQRRDLGFRKQVSSVLRGGGEVFRRRLVGESERVGDAQASKGQGVEGLQGTAGEPHDLGAAAPEVG